MQVQLWGPTNAAPIINTVVNVAEAEHRRIAPRVSRQFQLPIPDEGDIHLHEYH